MARVEYRQDRGIKYRYEVLVGIEWSRYSASLHKLSYIIVSMYTYIHVV